MVPGSWIAYGLAVALSFWGPRPPTCGEHVAVQPIDFHMGHAVAYADGFRCAIILDARPWTPWTRARVCKAIVHEYGHLKGHGHSRNPRSIMYPFMHRWRRCDRG